MPLVAEPDRWSRWLLEQRDGGDERQRAVSLARLALVRDRVLENAGPLEGATLLDVGTGDGLVGLEALARVGADGTVIFSDISEALLEQARTVASQRGLAARARFVNTRAEDLAEIADGSVDVVSTRSVLMYVADKTQAFSAMYRVLRAGGRISLFEPINRLMFPEPDDRFWGYDVGSVVELAAKVKAVFGRRQDPTTYTAMMGFDDRDLLQLAQAAGFQRLHVECHMIVEPGAAIRNVRLQTLLDCAPNPLAPTVREAFAASLTEPEQERLLAELGQAMAEGRCVQRSAVAYVVAQKRM